jgi:hypothetical protein
MQQPDEAHDSRHNGTQPLPLFRPEALLYQQQKSFGEIVLIRPLSLTILTCLALAIIALTGSFLLLGHYTEKVRVSGALLPEPSGTAGADQAQLRAELYVPARWIVSTQPGTQLLLRCPSCSSQFAEQPATVVAISAAPSTPDKNSTSEKSFGQSYKVTVALTPQVARRAGLDRPPQTSVPVEAEVSLGRKPLVKWLFKPSGS